MIILKIIICYLFENHSNIMSETERERHKREKDSERGVAEKELLFHFSNDHNSRISQAEARSLESHWVFSYG